MLTKNKVIRSLQDLPDTFSIEEMIDQLILVQKIELGLEQSDKNETFTSKQAESRLKKWLK